MATKVVKETKPAKAKAPKPAPKPSGGAPDGRRKPPAAGIGRPKGTPNKATTMAREAISKLADGMTSEVQGWLRWVALGVGTAWAEWVKPEDWDETHGEGTLPPKAKLLARGKLVLVPIEIDGRHTVNLQDVVDGLVPPGTVIDWIVEPDPDAAGNTMLRALEYHIPKLGRIEHTDPNGKALIPATIQIVGVKAPRRE